jgi:hypothetical protein
MIFDRDSVKPRPVTGTTAPIYIPRPDGSDSIRPGKDYFLIQVGAAQAAFVGSVWERVKALLVISQINLQGGDIDHNVRAIQRSRVVQRQRTELLGLQPNLVDLVPAVMPRVSISVEFVLDRQNRMEALTGLINNDSFLAAVSLAPGALAATKIVGGLAQKLVETFLDVEERQPILQFSGDFNIATGGLREGYYAILGSCDPSQPIPAPLPRLSVEDGRLLAADEPISNLSYLVFDVRRTEARTRDLSAGAQWEPKLRAAEARAEEVMANPLASEEERLMGWRDCQAMLREAQAVLNADPNFLRLEADVIIRAAYTRCCALVETTPADRGGAATVGIRVDSGDARAGLSIGADEDLDSTLDEYAEAVQRSKPTLRDYVTGPQLG